MEARGLPSWRGGRDDLVAQCDNPEGDVWVLDDGAAGVIGQTVVQRRGPPFGWTDAKRTESALYLSGSVTDPGAKAVWPGARMAWWAVDLAARQGVGWVRRHAQVPQVAAYDQMQSFDLVREEQCTYAGCTCWRGRPSGSTCRPGSGRVHGRNARAAWSSVITSTSFDHGFSL